MSGEDALREALARTLSTLTTCHGEEWPSEFHYRQADALLPVVLRHGREKAAEELRAAADWIWDEAPALASASAELHARADEQDPTEDGAR